MVERATAHEEMVMKIVNVSNGGYDCHVIVPNMQDAEAIAAAAGEAIDQEHFERDHCLSMRVMTPEEVLPINCDGVMVNLSVRQWCAVYDCIIKKPTIISQSEY